MRMMKSMHRARLMLMRWLIDSSIERGRSVPAWVRARLQRDDGLARYARAAREVDRRLKRSAAGFRPSTAGVTVPAGNLINTAARGRLKLTPWRARLAAAAAMALLLTAAAVVLTRRGSDVDGAATHVQAQLGNDQSDENGSALGGFASARLNELLDRTRGAIDADNLPLVIEARRLANDSREIGNRLLEQLPIRPAVLRRHMETERMQDTGQRDLGANGQHSGA